MNFYTQNVSVKTLLASNIHLFPHTHLDQLKRRFAKELGYMPKSSDLRSAYNDLLENKHIQPIEGIDLLFRVKKQRTLSGVAPFAVMMKPAPCPGKCTYCITEKGMPKSYMSDEPSAQRAVLVDFDPAQQVQLRIEQLKQTGHPTQKLQIIVIGGTFSAYEMTYKKAFLKGIFDGANGVESSSIEEAHLRNQTAEHRVVGLSIETRPDWVTEEELALLRQYGVTKVQLGVQTLDAEVSKAIRREHDVEAVKKATCLLRDAGFKINHHIMLNLPKSSPEKDVVTARLLFEDEELRPDTLKIYPCIVLPKTQLLKQWQKGQYSSYDDETLVDTLVQCKMLVPEYCRIDRLTRDITRFYNRSGTQKTNLRQLVAAKMKEENLRCACIRCREVRSAVEVKENLILKCLSYTANGAEELVLTYSSSQGLLYGLLRLRLSKKSNPAASLFKALEGAAMIRELQVFGQQLPFGASPLSGAQHQGLGGDLVQEAERLSQERGYLKIAVISGVGVRKYYEKQGYKLENTYMVKNLLS